MSDSAARFVPGRYRLRVVRGANAGLVAPLEQETVTVGRGRQATVHLDDVWLAQRSMQFRWDPECTSFVLTVWNHVVPLCLNGERCESDQPYRLATTDRLTIEGTEIVFERTDIPPATVAAHEESLSDRRLPVRRVEVIPRAMEPRVVPSGGTAYDGFHPPPDQSCILEGPYLGIAGDLVQMATNWPALQPIVDFHAFDLGAASALGGSATAGFSFYRRGTDNQAVAVHVATSRTRLHVVYVHDGKDVHEIYGMAGTKGETSFRTASGEIIGKGELTDRWIHRAIGLAIGRESSWWAEHQTAGAPPEMIVEEEKGGARHEVCRVRREPVEIPSDTGAGESDRCRISWHESFECHRVVARSTDRFVALNYRPLRKYESSLLEDGDVLEVCDRLFIWRAGEGATPGEITHGVPVSREPCSCASEGGRCARFRVGGSALCAYCDYSPTHAHCPQCGLPEVAGKPIHTGHH